MIYEGADKIYPTPDRVQWPALLNTIINLHVSREVVIP